ncbi:MAG: hypothetical protein JWQ49_3587 [Edaphobacter sp.]|nr:hypothetical protein [Edaphobacter sp.]
MDIDLRGRVRNIRLTASESLLPLFEAIVNAIHAVEDAQVNRGRIEVRCVRATQARLIDEGAREWVRFDISDNGIGFNDDNFASFSTSDSMWKAARGGKGVGRLLWLKAFDRCEIESCFLGVDKQLYVRKFDFELSAEGIERLSVSLVSEHERGTRISLIGYREPFSKAAPHSLTKIAQLAFDHCLEYLVLGRAPEIVFIEDGEEQISLTQMYSESVEHASAATAFNVRNQELMLLSLKRGQHPEETHASRPAPEKPSAPKLKRYRNE